MQHMPAVSRPAWMLALSGPGRRAGAPRRSPVEIVATMGSYLTGTRAARVSGLRTGPFGRWADGVNAMREDGMAFAAHWRAHNEEVLDTDGPLWVVLGDSTAQGLGAASPEGGYVGQVLAALRQQTGQPWGGVNPSGSGGPTPDGVGAPQAPARPAVAGAQLIRVRRAPPRRDRRPAAPAPRRARPGDLRDRRQRHPVHRSGQAVRRPARADRGGPGPNRPVRPAAARRMLGAHRPGQRALRDADQPGHPRRGGRARAAGRRGVRSFPAAVDREVRPGLLSSQPGRLSRLVPCPARGDHGRGNTSHRPFGIARVDQVSADGRRARAALDWVTLFDGHARFAGPHELVVEDTNRISADRIVLATGATSVVPPVIAGSGVEFHGCSTPPLTSAPSSSPCHSCWWRPSFSIRCWTRS